MTAPVQGQGGRCGAAHPADPTSCDGPFAVTVLDADQAGADGCEGHAARLLASLDRGRVYALPSAPAGAVIRVFRAAASAEPLGIARTLREIAQA
ncbi:hypothetical protein [Streptomyces sp. NPDC056672]|uniref:hypothetical protein n=1 Tax=Streptomyces sp. NPDC056672 TaxID=3345906 RepID=UPI0036A00DD3